jgi:hypothetical protein
VTDVGRRLLLGLPLASGRWWIDIEELTRPDPNHP